MSSEEIDKMVNDKILDSREYDILMNAARSIKGIQGLTCEMGVRMGGSSILIMKTLLENEDKRFHIAIDPYGNIEYTHFENQVVRYDYTSAMKYNAQIYMNTWCLQNNFEYLFFPLEDTEFFNRFADGVPIYNNFKEIHNSYALVFFDGPHTTALVKKEIDFFKDRTPIGGVWVFDDIDQYPHMEYLDNFISSIGFEILQKGVCKISYVRKGYTFNI